MSLKAKNFSSGKVDTRGSKLFKTFEEDNEDSSYRLPVVLISETDKTTSDVVDLVPDQKCENINTTNTIKATQNNHEIFLSNCKLCTRPYLVNSSEKTWKILCL